MKVIYLIAYIIFCGYPLSGMQSADVVPVVHKVIEDEQGLFKDIVYNPLALIPHFDISCGTRWFGKQLANGDEQTELCRGVTIDFACQGDKLIVVTRGYEESDCYDNTMDIWDINAQARCSRFNGMTNQGACCLDRQGNRLAFAGGIWNCQSAKREEVKFSGYLSYICFNEDDTELYATTCDGRLVGIDPKDGQKLFSLGEKKGPYDCYYPIAMKYHENAHCLAALFCKGRCCVDLKMVNTHTKKHKEIPLMLDVYRDIGFSDNGKLLLAGDTEKVYYINTDTYECNEVAWNLPGRLKTIFFDKGFKVLTQTTFNEIHVYDVESAHSTHTCCHNLKNVEQVAFDPSMNYFAINGSGIRKLYADTTEEDLYVRLFHRWDHQTIAQWFLLHLLHWRVMAARPVGDAFNMEEMVNDVACTFYPCQENFSAHLMKIWVTLPERIQDALTAKIKRWYDNYAIKAKS